MLIKVKVNAFSYASVPADASQTLTGKEVYQPQFASLRHTNEKVSPID